MRDTQTGLRERTSNLGALLASLSALVVSTGLSLRAGAQPQRPSQEQIDAALACIRLAEDGADGQTDGNRYRVVNQSPDVLRTDVDWAHLHAGHPLDVIVTVQASAQLGGLLLSFGHTQLDGDFRVRVAGDHGAQELTSASGTSLANIAAAINYFGPMGVRAATAFDSGVLVASQSFGSTSFVAVQVLEVDRSRPASGIYRMLPHAFGTPDPASRIRFDSPKAFRGVVDFGRDVRAHVNGWPAFGEGAVLHARSPELWADFELTTGHAIGVANAQTIGTFRAFTVLRR